MSKKPFDLDWDKIDFMLEAGCGGAYISRRLGINRKTLERACERIHKVPLGEYSRKKKEDGVKSIKLKQHEKALKGDTTMLIYLGKVRDPDQNEAQKNYVPNDKLVAELLDSQKKIAELEKKLADALQPETKTIDSGSEQTS